MARKPTPPTATELADSADINPWDQAMSDALAPTVTPEEVKQHIQQVIAARSDSAVSAEYDLEGLMNDFPTATELERFVYDQTGVVLNLKGRAQKLKYQIGMDVLNGHTVDAQFIGTENPYIDRAEMVPVEPLKEPAARDATLPAESEVQNQFYTPFIPHPDSEYRARNKKVQTIFKKYKNGMISYEVLGPIEPKPVGEKMDKFGRIRPELMAWVDPRTGEQVVVRADGTLTPQGRNLRALMQKLRVNNTNHWSMWVDRDFVDMEHGELRNPWDTEQ